MAEHNQQHFKYRANAVTRTIANLDEAQTFTNKTLTSPSITTPTGIVKGDVGLGNVENTALSTWGGSTNITQIGITTAPSLQINGSAGAGWIDIRPQSAQPSNSPGTNYIRLYGSPTGHPSYKEQSDGFERKFVSTLTADRVYTLSDADMTFVGTTNTQTLTNKDLTSGTNTFPTTLATLTGTQTLTNKTIAAGSNTISGIVNSNLSGTAGITYANLQNVAAHKMLANNTSSAATAAEDDFNHPGSQTYSGTITWDGTAPSGTSNFSYNWMQVGNMVHLTITLVYATAGATNTTATMALPAGVPAPVCSNRV
jgi:hypothetical protein